MSKIPAEAKESLIKKRLLGDTWEELAQYLKNAYNVRIDRTTVARWYAKEVSVDSIHIDDVETDSLRDRIRLDRRVATYQSLARYHKRLYETSLKEGLLQDALVDAIHEATIPLSKVPVTKSPKPTRKIRGESSQIVVAPLTDTHIGEYVSLEQMNYLNSYDFDIFNKRLHGWAKTVLLLTELRRASVPITELIIPMLGDMISGDIHDELIRTNQAPTMMQMARGANLIAQAIMYLAPHYDKITIPCVVGNHGRMHRKPSMKDKYVDWDYMLYQWVAAFCSEQKNIEFKISKSYLSSFKVFDKNILIMHGDSASGAGSISTITKVLTNLRSVLQYRTALEQEISKVNAEDPDSELPVTFDSVMMGHFHRVDELDIGTGHAIICGCVKGGDEFAMTRLAVITKPQQIVTYFHPRYGYLGKETIYLNQFDNDEFVFHDDLSSTWSDFKKKQV